MLASQIALYSGVSGGFCGSPRGFDSSQAMPAPGARRHWPFQSGYLVSSKADAADIVSTAAAATTAAPIEARKNRMNCLLGFSSRADRASALASAELDLPQEYTDCARPRKGVPNRACP